MRLAAACQVELVDGRPALLGGHAALADIAERAHPGEELEPIGARQQAPRPMPAGFELSHLPPWRIDAARARRVGEGDHAIGVADVERIAQQRHAERLVQALKKHLSSFGHAVAVRVAQQGDAVRADPHGGGALHRAEHGVVEDGLDGAGHGQGLGDKHVAIGQYVDPAGMLETGRKRIDLEPGRRNRRLPLGPAPCRGHLEGRDALRLGRRDRPACCPKPARTRCPPADATGP